ncbi:MAG: hypothetical protein HGA19_08535 [Oscillochloris sp.]|nr:hypothetical protein [Oscillochloris sp.]
MTNAVTLSEILTILRQQIMASLTPGLLHIYLYDALSDQYLAAPDETGQTTSDLRFAEDSVLPVTLRKDRFPIFIDQDRMPELVVFRQGVAPETGNLFEMAGPRERLFFDYPVNRPCALDDLFRREREERAQFPVDRSAVEAARDQELL